MTEDFWLPGREGGRGTEITTLPGGENLGQIDDILFFQKKLYKSLNVPLSRLESESGFQVGRATEINREEVKFQKYIDRLRKRFSYIILDTLRTQLLLKGIITDDDWDNMGEEISIDYIKDNYFTELKEFEVLRDRVEIAQQMEDYVGKYYSKEWVRKNIFGQSEQEMKLQDKQIGDEKDEGGDDLDLDLNSNNPTLESDIESKTNLEDMIPVSETQNHINNT